MSQLQPITPELRQWIVSQAQAGHKPEEVLAAMRASGWSEDVAIAAMEETLQGFLAEVQRRLVLRHPDPYLRFDFSDLGSYLSRGVAPFIMTFVVTLPFSVLFFATAVGITVATSMGLVSDVPQVREAAFFVGVGGAMLLFFPLWLFCIVLLNAATTRAELRRDRRLPERGRWHRQVQTHAGASDFAP